MADKRLENELSNLIQSTANVIALNMEF
jgi:hypothetical protein